jgi:Uma2 family endonuclease
LTESIEKRYYELVGTRPISYDEFSKIPYDGLGHHLLNGVHIITPAPSTKHQKISNNISFLFNEFLFLGNSGEIYSSPIDLKLSDLDAFQPDLVYISENSLNIVKENFIDGVPDLIIEILSPNSEQADFGWKKDLIQKYKIKEYWIVDPFNNKIHQFIHEKNELKLFKLYHQGDIISPLVADLNQLTIPTGKIFHQ